MKELPVIHKRTSLRPSQETRKSYIHGEGRVILDHVTSKSHSESEQVTLRHIYRHESYSVQMQECKEERRRNVSYGGVDRDTGPPEASGYLPGTLTTKLLAFGPTATKYTSYPSGSTLGTCG
jgi:hypothetical protein